MLLTVGVIAALVWIALVVLTLAMCTASARADATAERAYSGHRPLEI